jgi:hypothetical protein
MISSRFAIVCALALSATAACTDTESATNLNPDGPPMLEQVRLYESIFDATSGTYNQPRVFAFGTLPGIDASGEHDVSSAAVNGQALRIVVDEVLRGNRLEQIKCRADVNADGAYGNVPDGATPDDIAKCTVAKDVLPASCKGDHAVCLCENDAGCLIGGTDMVAKGAPVGVEDLNADGAADVHRFIPTAVQLICGAVTVSADPATSYWYPSGDQQIPAVGGADAIGPAIVFKPLEAASGAAIPTSSTCTLKFADTVVDKSDIQVCAPPGGRTADCTGNLDECKQSCTPGDVSAFSFKTEALSFTVSSDQTGLDRTTSFLLSTNTVVDTASATAAISMTQGGVNFTGFTITINNSSGRSSISIAPTAATGWAADTDYTVTVSTALTDTFGQALPASQTVTFHTAT